MVGISTIGTNHHKAEHEHQDQPDHEVAVAEHAHVEKWLGRGQAVRDEQIVAEQRERRPDQDLVGLEPVQPLAAIERQLGRRDRDRERDEAEPVEPAPRLAAALGHERQAAEQGDDAERHHPKNTQRQS
jgi:hypothetical protein